jgi:hypothetical protein
MMLVCRLWHKSFLISAGYRHLSLSFILSADLIARHQVHHNRRPLHEGAANIAAHYKFIMGDMFSHHSTSKHILLVEDDMIFAPDFLLYFAQLAPVMDVDSSVWCISSWNDNGFAGHARDAATVYRTDFFIGLGWLMPRRVWNEVRLCVNLFVAK